MAKVLTRGAYDVLTRGEKKDLGYKYVTRLTWVIELDHNYGTWACHHQRYDLPPRAEPYFEMKGNILTVHPGYGWDGCSGPTLDTAGNMAPGLAHDCLYQAMRLRFLPDLWNMDWPWDGKYRNRMTWDECRKKIDDDFRALLEAEGWGTHRTRKTRVGWFFQRNWGRFRKTYYHGAVRVAGKGSAKPKVPEGWTYRVPKVKAENPPGGPT